MGDQWLDEVPTSEKWAAVVGQVLTDAGLLADNAPRLAASILRCCLFSRCERLLCDPLRVWWMTHSKPGRDESTGG